MKRLTLFAVLLAVPALAQGPHQVDLAPLALSYDLDGEAADADHVVASASLADSTSYTVAANPDICRLVDMTLTDADSSTTAGVITITGTDCLGEALVGTYTFDGSGSAVYDFTITTGNTTAAYFSTVTSVVTGVLTGEGSDSITVGYTTVPTNSWVMYGRRKPDGPTGERFVSPFDSTPVGKLITTSGAASTTVTSVNTDSPYELVAVGDLLLFNVSGTAYERRVTARASANSITINSAVNIPAAGVTFRFKDQFISTDPGDATAFFIPVSGAQSGSFVMDVNANANTGGIVSNVECAVWTAEGFSPLVQVDTDTVATGSTGTAVSAVDFRLAPYTHCAFGLWFGTNDDADAADEDIDIVWAAVR